MNQQGDREEPIVLSYLGMRKAVGIIGFVLPFVLGFGGLLLSQTIQPSISDYYYTPLRNVLVGSLCAIGVFLVSTKGFDRKDEIAGYLSGIFAIGVAFIAKAPPKGVLRPIESISPLHFTFATLLFLTFAYFCLFLFVTTAKNRPPTRRKLQRNILYRVSGIVILIAVFLIAIVHLPSLKDALARFDPVFWLESLAVIAFGVAWLTKGEMILKDLPEPAKAPDEYAKRATAT